jgi:Styrene monooxygenase A putative substrate binding domain
MSEARSFTIVGGGHSGLQLACGLVDAGHKVRVVQNRTAEEIAKGPVLSSQSMFHLARQYERDLGLNYWENEAPPIQSIHFSVRGDDGGKVIDWNGKFDPDKVAHSVDQRVKFPRWMSEFQKKGGEIVIKEVGIEDLEAYTKESGLVIVAAGKGDIAKLFERDPSRSLFDKPQRAMALTYVKGMAPRPDHTAINFNVIPGVGEYFTFEALTTTGICDIMIFEGLPGGPMDCWKGISSPDEHLEKSKWVLETFVPWEAERCKNIELTDANGRMSGTFTPTVRKPVGKLPSGAMVLGLGDTVCLNDPLTGQGSNNASKSATCYLKAILAHGKKPFDEAFMQATFESFWEDARFVVEWTNMLLQVPPPHVGDIGDAAQRIPAVAKRIVDCFSRPRDLFPWYMYADDAKAYLAKVGA